MEKQLPKNWVETELGNYAMLKNGYAFKSNDFQTEGLPVVKISNIKDFKIEIENSICVDESKLKSDFIIAKGDILIAMSGATTGKYGVYEQDVIALQNQRVGNLKPVVESLSNRRFLLYLLGSLKEEIEEKAYGAAQPNISPKLIESINIFLPPLPEQNRIVDKLDRLFAQLETIKTSMANIPLLLKDFRQQVLTQAVTGKLTEEWRKGRELEEWKNVNIEYLVNSLRTDIRTGPFGSALKKDEHQNEGIPVWGIESIGLNGKFTGFNKIYVTVKKANDLKSFEVKGGNIIISRSGTVGELCILPDNIDYGLISTNLMKIILNNDVIISKYFCWLFKGSPIVTDKLKDLCKGSTRLFLTQTILKNLDFPLPPIQEQQEIVSRVENLFAKADAIEQQYKTLKASIDTLPQALLHKAFKGELSEQLDTDGVATNLLEEIKALKASTGKVIKSKTNKSTAKKVKPYRETEDVLGMVAESIK